MTIGLRAGAPRMHRVAAQRWPFFVDAARRNGIAAVFAYPLTSADVNIGVLTLYQDAEGDLTAVQHEDSLSIAEVVTIHQASGMIAVQLQIHPDEALIRLRGCAFANSEPLAAIATQVIRGQLRLANDRTESDRRS